MNVEEMINELSKLDGKLNIGFDGESDYINLVTSVKVITPGTFFNGTDYVKNDDKVALIKISSTSAYSYFDED